MILKKIVAVSLISSMSLMFLILIGGLVLPASLTDKIRGADDAEVEVVALDEDGQPIEGAKLQQNADGTQTVVDEDGQPLSGTEPPTSTEPTPPVPTETTPAPAPAPAPTPAPAPSKPAPPPTPAPPACGSPGGSCTAAQVATHNSPSNCWVIYSGSYYIITNYVNKHEGGSGAFTSSTCGQDISAYLDGSTNAGTTVRKKKHSDAAYNILNSYKIGPVK